MTTDQFTIYTDDEARGVAETLLRQIGTMNVYAISGGRKSFTHDDEGVEVILPCRYGYEVRVKYVAARDTYTVTRGYKRGMNYWIKGQMENVYCEDLGETAYRAGMFRDDWTTAGAMKVI
jgi:hypothetical protein